MNCQYPGVPPQLSCEGQPENDELNKSCPECRREAVSSIGNYLTNVATLDGVVIAVTLAAMPKKFTNNYEYASASAAGLLLFSSLVLVFFGLGLQVGMLSNGEPLRPRGSALETLTFWALGCLIVGLGFVAWYAFLVT